MRSFAHRRKDTSAVVRGKDDRPLTFDLTWRATGLTCISIQRLQWYEGLPARFRQHRRGKIVANAAIAMSSRRISVAARFGASPAQIAALAFVALFLVAYLVVPIVRVIFVAFTDRDGSLTLVNFQDF